jgi:hypothetical protein
MSRTYRDQRKWAQKHRVWVRAYEPGRNRWELPGERWLDLDPPCHCYTRTARHRVNQALRSRDLENAILYVGRKYNNHEG